LFVGWLKVRQMYFHFFHNQLLHILTQRYFFTLTWILQIRLFFKYIPKQSIEIYPWKQAGLRHSFYHSLIHTHTSRNLQNNLNFCAAIDILSSATEILALIRHSQQKNKEKKFCAATSPKKWRNILVCPKKKKFCAVPKFLEVHIS
jgi:hypothetical protein